MLCLPFKLIKVKLQRFTLNVSLGDILATTWLTRDMVDVLVRKSLEKSSDGEGSHSTAPGIESHSTSKIGTGSTGFSAFLDEQCSPKL